MEIKGKLIAILPSTTGQSQKGNWYKSEIIIETAETYPKKIKVDFFGKERSTIEGVRIGSNITCHVNLESKEYNGKYYTSVNCWKYVADQSAAPKASAPANDSPKSFQDDSVDDLPF